MVVAAGKLRIMYLIEMFYLYISVVAGMNAVVGKHISPQDAVLTYLPQAHIIEFAFENMCLYWGCTMGYGSLIILSNNSIRNCKGDSCGFHPTDSGRWTSSAGIDQEGHSGRSCNQRRDQQNPYFWGALRLKSTLLFARLPGISLRDTVVFKTIKEAAGGRLKVMMDGGGPIARDTQTFLSMTIVPLLNRYGLAETCGMGAINDPLAWVPNSLGELPVCIEVMLVGYVDGGYSTQHDPPQSENLNRHASVATEY
jgi:long-chain acyl-CoA synthetase